MEKAETAILRRANDQYRQIIFNAQVYANTGAGTYEKAVDMATKDMLSAGLNCVEYSNGARHTLKDYAEMAIRTASKRAYLQGEGVKRQEWGISTVIVNKRGNPCPKCLPFCGKVLIDDVWSGGSKKDGKYPLMSYAVSQGLYHPRCKDSHTTYFPGISTADDTWTEEELDAIGLNAKMEAKRLYAKRQAEKYDRMAKYSLDADNKRMYQNRAEQWQEMVVDGGSKDGLTPIGGEKNDKSKGSTKIDILEKELQELDKKMESATDFDEMIQIQNRQDEIREEIKRIRKEEAEQLRIQSTQSASNRINSLNVFEKEIDLNKCDAQSAEAIASATEKVAKEFPDLKLKNLRISESNMHGSVRTDADSLGKTVGKSMVFNGKYMDDHDKLSEILQKQYEKGFVATRTVEGTVLHEYGHAISNAYDIKEGDIMHEIMRNHGYDPKKGMPKSDFDDIFHISNYGDSSSGEWFAECFADYMENENPKDISIEAIEIFKKMVG
jgi:hypothetical protein